MGANEFGGKPPDVKPLPPVVPPKDRQADIVDLRAKIDLEGRHRPPEPKTPADRARALNERLPPMTPGRDGYERSPVRQFEQSLEKQGYSPERIGELRKSLRDNPQLCAAAGPRYAEMLHDFARMRTTPPERFVQPQSPEVDALVHKAVGKPPGEYVSKADLDKLTQTVSLHQGELRQKGFSEADIDRVRGYLVRDTGRVPRSELVDPVMTGDGRQHATPEEAVRHDRLRMVDATAQAPVATGVARAWGVDLDTVEHVAQAAARIQDVVGAYVLHTAAVRAGFDAARAPVAPQAIVPEAGRTTPERPAAPETGSYAKELFTIRDKAYELALADARQMKAEHGREYTATTFGTVVHGHFGVLANESVREGRLPATFVVNDQSKLDRTARGLDAWDQATGIGFDVTTATTRSVLGHEKHVGVPARDGTPIQEYLPLVYPSFKDTKRTLGWQ